MMNEEQQIDFLKKTIKKAKEQQLNLTSEIFDTFSNFSEKLVLIFNKKNKVFIELNNIIESFAAEAGKKNEKIEKDILISNITHFTCRTRNSLLANGIVSLNQLIEMSQYTILRLPYIGKKSFEEIKEVLRVEFNIFLEK